MYDCLSNCTETITWQGWALYYVNLNHKVMLFDEYPEPPDQYGRWYISETLKMICCPYFLRECGISVPFDDEDFHCNGDYDGGHQPVRIYLTLPKALAEMWKMKPSLKKKKN